MPPQPTPQKGPQEGKVPKFRPRLRAFFDPPIPKPRPWLLPLSNLPPPSLAIHPPPPVTPSQISDPPSSYKERSGGKALKLRTRLRTPYDRPIRKESPLPSMPAYQGEEQKGKKAPMPPLQSPPSTPYNPPVEKKNGWLSKLVFPASQVLAQGVSRLFSSVFGKRSANTSEEISQLKKEVVSNGDKQPRTCGIQEIFQVEELIKESTFTRADFNRLTEIMRERMVEPTMLHDEFTHEKANPIGASQENKTYPIGSESAIKPYVSKWGSSVLDDNIGSSGTKRRICQKNNFMYPSNNKRSRLDGNIINYSATGRELPTTIQKSICFYTKGEIKDLSNSANKEAPAEKKIDALQHKTDILQLKEFTHEKANATVLVQEDDIHCIGSESAIKHSVSKWGSSVLDDNFGSSGPKRRICQKCNFMYPSNKRSRLDENIINYSDTRQELSISVQKPICLDTKGDIKYLSNNANLDPPSEQKIDALQHKTDTLRLKEFNLEKANATVLVQEDVIHCIGSESAIKHSVHKRKRCVLHDISASSGTKRRIMCQLNDRRVTFDGNINNTDGCQGLPTPVQKLICMDSSKYDFSNLHHAYKGETKDPLHSANQDAPSEQKIDALQQKMDTQPLALPPSPNKDAPSDSDQPSLRNWNSSPAPTAPPPLSETSTSGFTLCSEESHTSSPIFAFHSEGSESTVQPTMTKTNILHETTQESSKFMTSSEEFGLPAINNENAPSDLDVSRLGNRNSSRETNVPSNLSENLAVHDEVNHAFEFKLESEVSNKDSNVPSLRCWNSPQALIESPSVHDEQTTAQEFSIDTEESHSPALGFALISHKPPSSCISDSISMESVARTDAGFENEEITSSAFSSNYGSSQFSNLLSMATSYSDTPSFESDARFCPFTNSNIIESLSKSLNCLRLI